MATTPFISSKYEPLSIVTFSSEIVSDLTWNDHGLCESGSVGSHFAFSWFYEIVGLPSGPGLASSS